MPPVRRRAQPPPESQGERRRAPHRALVGIGQILATAELDRRPSRTADYASENRALVALAGEMATSPDTVFKTLADTVLALCRADSAGISILEPGGETGVIRWHAAAGVFAQLVGATMPRQASPCGTALVTDRVLLLDRPERCFPALRGIRPPILESLVAPFRLHGEPVGTVWALAHSPERKFDAEDARVLASLARFAAADRVRIESALALRRANETLEARVEERTAELMAAEAALRQSQKMEAVGQLTGGVAHDFNNMLQGISCGLELVQRRIEQGRVEEAGQFAAAARKTVERAAALTHRLLGFARRQVLQPRAVQPDTLVEGMAELIRRTVGPAITVVLRVESGIWTVLCDPNQLENVLLNLSINARDAMPEGGTLTFGIENASLQEADVVGQGGARAGEYVGIAVADTGTGMDEATRERAFEPFFTTKPTGQGTGLGLSQLYGFARQSGCVVRLDSAPGHGTTVRLYLPRHEKPGNTEEVEPDTAADALPAGAAGTVLLVEDEAEVRTVTAAALRGSGHQVLEAADGAAALRVLDSSFGLRVDLLVTDVGLPGCLNGRQVAEAARERLPRLPVLFITGYYPESLIVLGTTSSV